MPSILRKNGNLEKAVSAFNFLKTLSESELETLEILSDKDQRETVMAGLEESEKGKIHSIHSIL